MGEVIANKAAADDIFADVVTTHARAVARGGKWQELAEERLGAVLGVITNLQSRLAAAESEVLPLRSIPHSTSCFRAALRITRSEPMKSSPIAWTYLPICSS